MMYIVYYIVSLSEKVAVQHKLGRN